MKTGTSHLKACKHNFVRTAQGIHEICVFGPVVGNLVILIESPLFDCVKTFNFSKRAKRLALSQQVSTILQ